MKTHTIKIEFLRATAGGGDVRRFEFDANGARAGRGSDEQRDVAQSRAKIEKDILRSDAGLADQGEDVAGWRGLVEDILGAGWGSRLARGEVRFWKSEDACDEFVEIVVVEAAGLDGCRFKLAGEDCGNASLPDRAPDGCVELHIGGFKAGAQTAGTGAGRGRAGFREMGVELAGACRLIGNLSLIKNFKLIENFKTQGKLVRLEERIGVLPLR